MLQSISRSAGMMKSTCDSTPKEGVVLAIMIRFASAFRRGLGALPRQWLARVSLCNQNRRRNTRISSIKRGSSTTWFLRPTSSCTFRYSQTSKPNTLEEVLPPSTPHSKQPPATLPPLAATRPIPAPPPPSTTKATCAFEWTQRCTQTSNQLRFWPTNQ